MKKMKKIALVAVMAISVGLFITSCNKSEKSADLTAGLTGTYIGTLETNNLKTNNPATAYISKVNDYSITIHCFGDDIDTTFVMDLYENGDSTMLCFTDDDFQTEYNHQMTSGHHMMGENNWQSWTNHMNLDHNPTDEHYGAFSMTNHTFSYRFKTPGSTSTVDKVFTGTKEN